MKNKKIFLYFAGLAIITAAVVFLTVNFKKRTVNANNPEFAKYITAYTSGIISKNDPVQIKLTSTVTDKIKNKENLPENILEIKPSIKGKLTLINNTIEFTPEKNFDSGKEYFAEFSLGKLMKVDDELRTFSFKFKTIKQAFDYGIEEQKTIDKKKLKYQQITGFVNTADAAAPDDIEKILTVTEKGKKLSVKWTSDIDNIQHKFVIDSIERFEKATTLILKWNGKAIGVNKKEEQKIEIPAIGDFNLMSYKVIQYPDQYLQLQFTDPLDETQNLNGLISISGVSDLRFIIDDNIIKVYSDNRIRDIQTVFVYEGIKNILGYKLIGDQSFELAFEAIKPAVRITGKGTILPSGEKGLILPFEAVNLKAVDVTIIKIYENNILQFLQDNEFEGNYNLRQVGKPIIRKKIDLTKFSVSDFGTWNRFSLDLNKIINTEPGAIYRVELNFKKQYSLYMCDNDDDNTISENEEDNFNEEQETTNWDSYDNEYYYDDYYFYDYWEDRDNPCKKAYYGINRKVAKNIIASDLGLIAKQSENGTINIFTADIITAKPKAGVTVEIYDFQQQLLASGETDPKGKLILENIKDPYFVVAKHGTQRAYLKLNDGNSLSLSRFDVSGEKIKKGIKGFIYGERGVWRPGDSIFITFILKDDLNSVPEGHPIIFKLKDPQGKLVKKEILTKNKTNFYGFIAKTEDNAITGNYNLNVSVGSVSFNKTVKIETIKPNRLKIDFNFPDKIIQESKTNSAVINVKWLHGAPGKNLKVKVNASLYPATTSFNKYSDFSFDDPTKHYKIENNEILDNYTDEQGNVNLNADFYTNNEAPGMMKAVFITKAFEKGGNFSIDQYTLPYSPYSSYTGIKLPKGDKIRGMLLTDKKHKIEIVTLTPDGKLLKEKHKINLKFYKLTWRWWFDASANNVSSYNFRNSATLLKSETVTTSGGKTSWNIQVNYPEWGRYLVIAEDLQSGHSAGKIVYIDWPGWAGRAQKGDSEGASMLTFISDKDKYNVGEKVKLTIPTGKNGRALISIENGTKVIKSYWIETKEGETDFEFQVSKNMTPNVFVNVTLLQPHSQTANDLPVRMYGVIPVMVEDPETHLKPKIKMPDEIESGKKFTITVSEESGKNMTYTLAVVDEGLLDITRFKTPDPWGKFFAKEALGVKTWDMYNDVIGAYAGELERLFAIGGGMEEDVQNKSTKANRFKPVVKYLGPFTLGKGDKQTHTLTIDNYIGSVRAMVVAGNNGAYGSTEKAVPVIKPLMIIGTLPRILSPGESLKLPVSIFAMKNNIKTVKISVKTNNLFTVNGKSYKTIKFNEPGEQNEFFELKVNNKTGKGEVILTAASGNFKSEYKIEIDIRNPNNPSVSVIEKVLSPGETWETEYSPTGTAGTNTGITEVSSIPPVNLEKRLKYLIQFPYGCVEQTTSSVFPQLYVSNLVDLSKEQKNKIETNIKEGIKRLEKFQLTNGGFSYWQNGTNVSIWGTNYAGHFLIEAKKKGYAVPSGIIQSWKKYQKKKAKNWINDGPVSQLEQAYRLYTLALAGDPAKSAMNRLKNTANLSLQAKWRLAAAYLLSGKKTTAKNMITGLGTDIKKYTELSHTFGTEIRDKAMILETLTLTGNKAKAYKLLKEISEELSSNRYMSTQTTAYSLIAVSMYTSGSETKPLKYRYSINGSNVKSVNSDKAVSQIEINISGTKPGKLKIENTSSDIIYVGVILQGIPPVGVSSDSQKDLRISVSYSLPDGTPLSPLSIEQGTDFTAEVTITHPGILKDYKNLALSQIFPSGWEIINTRLYDTGITSSSYDNKDIRDDRVYTYFDLKRGKSKTFRVLLNASYAGKFWMPPVYCNAMYDDGIFARKGGKYVTVK